MPEGDSVEADLPEMLPAETPVAAKSGDGAALRGDLMGALVAAVITISESVPLGLMTFAALGTAFAGMGVIAGLYGAVAAGLVAAALGGAPRMLSGPRASVAVIMASMVATAAQAPDLENHGGPTTAIALALFGVFLAGVLQGAFGIARLGKVIKFIPYPVVAGFMNGVAILLLLSQLRGLLALPEDFAWADWRDIRAAASPWGVTLAGVTMLVITMTPKVSRHAPALLIGLLAGVALHHGLQPFVGAQALGATVGTIPPAVPSFAIVQFWDQAGDTWILDRLWELMPSVAILAVIASIDSLMGAAVLDSLTAGRHDSNRELLAQGLSNMASAAVGGLGSSGAVGRSAAALKAGAQTRRTGIISALLVLVGTVAAGPWMGYLPRSVLAAVLAVVALGIMDTWSRELLSRLRLAGPFRRTIAANLVIVVAVAAVTVIVNLITAVIAGVMIAMVMFVRDMSKPIVRRHYDGSSRRSLKVRERSHAEHLALRGRQIVVVELDGPLFFGTADALFNEVERLSADARVVILDCGRLADMDATGVRLLLQLFQRMLAANKIAVIAHMTRDDLNGKFLGIIAGERIFDVCRLFADTDAALEWAEDRILENAGIVSSVTREIDLNEFAVTAGLTAEEQGQLTTLTRRRELPAGTMLFREGDEGDSFFMLAKGTVTIRLVSGHRAPIRLANLIPGVIFGEMAMLEGERRSAEAVADTEIVIYEVRKADFDHALHLNPTLAAKVVANMAREIAARLRVTNNELRMIS
jgi:SulP family sulfate permease